MDILNGLNKEQRQAVETVNCHVRIVAGAGSGKTRVVTTRIVYLIEHYQIIPYRILAITFTNKAANEMKERVNKMLEVNQSGVMISTIHSLCVRILREEIRFFKYPRNFVILDSDDQKSILKEIYKQFKIDAKDVPYARAIGYISGNKCAFIDADTASKTVYNELDKMLAAIYKAYENKLQDMLALDFDDLLIFTYQLFKQSPEIREKWQNRFDYIHVDEFQDVDFIQYGIIKYLVGKHAHVCVVGDPDQTIYTWRGAKVDIIMNFEKDFLGCQSIILNQNYRSTKSILKGTNQLIKNNQFREDKELFTSNEEDHKIVFYESPSEELEAIWIAKRIKLLLEEKVPVHEIAILYRSNYLSRNLEKVLLDYHIPYRIYGGVKFFERAEIKDAISYLRLLVEDNRSMSELAIKRVINVPKRGIGPKTVDTIQQVAQSTQEDYFDVLCQYPVAKGKTQQLIDQFVNLIQKYRGLKAEYSIAILMRKLLEESKYIQYLEDAKELDRLDNINELIHDIEIFEENQSDGSLDDYLQMISLYTDTQDEEVANSIQLMSVHAAKGLEFENVFVYSVSEGIFPNERSMSEGGTHALEEERRLAYVAFTRAKKKLYLSSSTGFSYVSGRLKSTSRFVKELGEDVVEKDFEMQSRYQPKAATSIQSVRREGMASSKMPLSKKRKSIRKGDIVHHETFGDGIVIALDEGVAKIAFEKKYGIKKLASDHPMLMKK